MTSNGKENIRSLFMSKEQELQVKLNVVLSHPTTKGNDTEQNWITFLRSFLPNKYGITKGYVIDYLSHRSEQIDIIIYDALYSPLIFETNDGEKYVTAESVYAIFESKSEINSRNIKYAAKKVKSVSKLARTSREIVNAGSKVPPRNPPQIIGGILANSSVKEKALRSALANNNELQIGFAASAKTIFIQKNGHPLEILENNNQAILAFFLMFLDKLHEAGTVPCIDIREYAYGVSPLYNKLFEKE